MTPVQLNPNFSSLKSQSNTYKSLTEAPSSIIHLARVFLLAAEFRQDDLFHFLLEFLGLFFFDGFFKKFLFEQIVGVGDWLELR